MQSIMSCGSDAEFLPARKVADRYNVSFQSLWRWLGNESLGFPRPTYVNGRRYWSRASLEEWEHSRPQGPQGRGGER
jgi:predicted DNA-binding transcriptional regulator AlpA